MFEGEIRDIDLIGRLVELWRERFTGAIRFENDGVIKILYLKEGDVLSASTNDRADSVDEILMRAGKVSREHVKQALTKRKESETLGDALLNLGFITRKELTWGRRMQVISVLRSAGEWQSGTFTIVADYLPKREEGTIFPLPQVIVELIVTDGDRPKYERLLESGSAVFSKAPDFDESFRQLGLNEDAEAVTAQINGDRTASEVASASGQETFNAFKLIHALSLLGLLKKEPGVPKTTFSGFGVADAADVWSGAVPALAMPSPVEPPVTVEEPAIEAQIAPPTLDLPAIDVAAALAEPPPPLSLEPLPEPPPRPPEKPLPSGPVPTPPARPSFSGTRTSTGTKKPLSGPPKKKSGGRFGLIVALMIVAVVGALGFFGYTWWTGREAASTAIAAPVSVAPPAQPPTTHETPAAMQTVELVPTTVTETATPAPAATPSSSLKERYDAMARDYARSPSGSFTVQFAIVCEPSNVANSLRVGGSEVWFIPIAVKDRSCYRLFWGRFDTREAAQGALPQLPAGLRESRPAVVAIPK